MRICHFADNHLGAGSGPRENDIFEGFKRAVDKIVELRPDLIINAGDLFHTVQPSNKVIAFASRQLLRLGRDHKIPTVIISGNHDAPKQKYIAAALSIFEDYENIHVIYKSRYEKIRIGDVSVSAVPHCLTPEILHQELARILPVNDASINILVLHGVVGGIKAFQMADLSEQMIPSDCFKNFDYVALGHYHNFTKVDKNIYYSGSTERLSQAESGYKKGIIEAEFGKSGLTDIRFHEIPTRVMLDLPPVEARGHSADEIMAQIEQKIRDKTPEDKIIRLKVDGISEETYRALSFDKIAEMKSKAYSLDIQFIKEEKKEDSLYADLNLGRLDLAFEKFISSSSIEKLEKEKLAKMGIDYLNRAEEIDD
ncbi:MAG: exonuclease SbcCD subunit D [candidate division Zixibacteria bacterium]